MNNFLVSQKIRHAENSTPFTNTIASTQDSYLRIKSSNFFTNVKLFVTDLDPSAVVLGAIYYLPFALFVRQMSLLLLQLEWAILLQISQLLKQ